MSHKGWSECHRGGVTLTRQSDVGGVTLTPRDDPCHPTGSHSLGSPPGPHSRGDVTDRRGELGDVSKTLSALMELYHRATTKVVPSTSASCPSCGSHIPTPFWPPALCPPHPFFFSGGGGGGGRYVDGDGGKSLMGTAWGLYGRGEARGGLRPESPLLSPAVGGGGNGAGCGERGAEDGIRRGGGWHWVVMGQDGTAR